MRKSPNTSDHNFDDVSSYSEDLEEEILTKSLLKPVEKVEIQERKPKRLIPIFVIEGERLGCKLAPAAMPSGPQFENEYKVNQALTALTSIIGWLVLGMGLQLQSSCFWITRLTWA
ncbi:MAG: hypothetical protein IBX50_11880 [Marinospirillum sp.]|uniref:hypothetical protein n=1 Tax=Marinospirillum sp. TaxID=2183934 RepID=UPI001A0B25C8|nr:hypothetical protein [Marinospirillum sp.]MBE0507398.1 hypothetical protein [Marinospirillum sp.]